MSKGLNGKIAKTVFQQKKFMTANHYLCIPDINSAAEIVEISAINRKSKGILSLKGKPLVSPIIKIDGEEIKLKDCNHFYSNGFIPTFKKEASEVEITIQVMVNEKTRGFIYSIDIKNLGDYNKTITLGIRGGIKSMNCTIRNTIETDFTVITTQDENTAMFSAEAVNNYGSLAFSVIDDLQNGNGLTTPDDGYLITNGMVLLKDKSKTVYYCFGIGDTMDSSALACCDMVLQGGEHLAEETRKTLDLRLADISDTTLAELAVYNLNMAYYCGIAISADTHEWIFINSSSPRNNHPAYFSHTNFTHTFFVYLKLNPKLAREILLLLFRKTLKHPGSPLRDSYGEPLLRSISLDNVVAPIVLLENYIASAGDKSVMDEPCIKSGISSILNTLDTLYDTRLGLYESHVDCDGIKLKYKYLTAANVTVWYSLKFCSEHGYVDKSRVSELFAAITKNCTRAVGGNNIYVYAVDRRGNFQLSDCPNASLFLLPYYGFCSNKFSFYQNTVNFLSTTDNEHFRTSVRLMGFTSEQRDDASISAVCSYLLSDDYKFTFTNVLRNLTLPTLAASEFYDPKTGAESDGFDNPASAALLARTIFHIYGIK